MTRADPTRGAASPPTPRTEAGREMRLRMANAMRADDPDVVALIARIESEARGAAPLPDPTAMLLLEGWLYSGGLDIEGLRLLQAETEAFLTEARSGAAGAVEPNPTIVGRYRPCELCQRPPSAHNPHPLNDGYAGHEYR